MRYDEPVIYGIDANGNRKAIKVDIDGNTIVSTNTSISSNTATPTIVASSASSVTILAANASRKGAAIYNNSTANLFIEFGATATTSAFTVKLTATSYYEIPFNYTGVISGIWDAVNGAALVRELIAFGIDNSPQPVNITYSNDEGLFYYLGTNKGATTWSNPFPSALTITASSLETGALSSLVDRQPSDCYTSNIPNSWFDFSINSGKLICNYYSIRNRSGDSSFIRNWKLQGSNDNNTWADLDTQVNNTTLVNSNQWLSLPVTPTIAYSDFRILQNGLNSSGGDFLCLGEFELYGSFIP